MFIGKIIGKLLSINIQSKLITFYFKTNQNEYFLTKDGKRIITK